MDTIVNLCYRRCDKQGVNHTDNSNCSYQIERFPVQDYQLIRLIVWEPVKEHPQPKKKFFLFRSLLRLVQQFLERRQSRLHANMEKKLRIELEEELNAFLDEMGDNLLCYEEGMPQECWARGILPLREFDDYLQPKWVRRLLPFARNHHFVVLGSAPCLQQLLCELAPQMKSLLWIAPDLTYQEQLEDFAEDFYQEYGLAMTLHFLPVGGTYGQMRIPDHRYSEPVNILDFSDGRHVPVFNPPEGSVWLDMASVYEKERRIKARRLRVNYISLKRIWRENGKSPVPS